MKQDKKFEWSDKSVIEFAAKLLSDRINWAAIHDCSAAPLPIQSALNQFKESHSNSGSVEWEIVEWVGNDGCILVKDNRSNSFVSKPGDLIRLYESQLLSTDSAWRIHSVLRKSDNVTFSVGDEVCGLYGKEYSPIAEFKIENGKFKCNLVSGAFFLEIKYMQKKLPPERTKLFTTADGKDIFEGDEYCYLENWEPKIGTAGRLHAGAIGTFSTHDKAIEYVTLNKPCLSLKEIKHWTENYFQPPAVISIEYLKELVKSKIKL